MVSGSAGGSGRCVAAPARPDEGEIWCHLAGHGAEGAVATFEGDPRCRLLARRGGSYVGRLHGAVLSTKLYMLRSFVVADGEEVSVVGRAFTDLLAQWSRDTGMEVLSSDAADNATVNGLLEGSGFVVARRKLLVARDLSDLPRRRSDSPTYRSLAGVGEESFVLLLTESSVGDPFEEEEQDPREAFADLVEYAGSQFDAAWWQVAYLDDRPVGVVLPQRFASNEGDGTIFYVGVRPAFRGRGLGTVLHAAGLAFLAGHGVSKYFGSTDTRNEPMVRIFESNGCRPTAVQLYYRVASSLHR